MKFFKIVKKILSQVAWPHNGLKYFFRFFRFRISQFEKLNENFFSKNLKFFKKILSLRSRDLTKGKNRVKNFLLHFWNQNDSIRKKKQNIFFDFFEIYFPEKMGQKVQLENQIFPGHAVFCKCSQTLYTRLICDMGPIQCLKLDQSGKNLDFGQFWP